MSDALWYFAYGSNLDPETFLGRRGMHPREMLAAALDSFELVFNLPVGPGERGVANLRPRAGAHVHGVAYAIDPEQAAHLDRTEGVHRGYYLRNAVRLEVPQGRVLNAFAYMSLHGVDGRKPSERYLGLLLRGARYHGLPEAWIRHLRGLEVAMDERSAGQLESGIRVVEKPSLARRPTIR
ncbi:MAG TPA: gamma-glutamylcyclotransferase family protein [Myxococcota bacterium]|nr:gamma-glutamylcyclotransferase family protein [Myxococcota bacterium]